MTTTLYRYDHYESAFGYDTEFHASLDQAITAHRVDTALRIDGDLPEQATYHQITAFTVTGPVPADATYDEYMALWQGGEIADTLVYMDEADMRPEFLRVTIDKADPRALIPLYHQGGAAYLGLSGPTRWLALRSQDASMVGMRSQWVDSGRVLRIPIPNDRTGEQYNEMMADVAVEVVRLLDSYEEVQGLQRTEGRWDEQLLDALTEAVEEWFQEEGEYTIIRYTIIDDAGEWLHSATTVKDGVISIDDIDGTITIDSTDDEIDDMAAIICERELHEKNILEIDDVIAYLRARIADLASDDGE